LDLDEVVPVSCPGTVRPIADNFPRVGWVGGIVKDGSVVEGDEAAAVDLELGRRDQGSVFLRVERASRVLDDEKAGAVQPLGYVFRGVAAFQNNVVGTADVSCFSDSSMVSLTR